MNLILTLLLSFLVIITVVTAMAIGVMAGRQPIKGSCGGLNGRGCELCSGSGSCKRRAES